LPETEPNLAAAHQALKTLVGGDSSPKYLYDRDIEDITLLKCGLAKEKWGKRIVCPDGSEPSSEAINTYNATVGKVKEALRSLGYAGKE
jgi:hypothetical protein